MVIAVFAVGLLSTHLIHIRQKSQVPSKLGLLVELPGPPKKTALGTAPRLVPILPAGSNSRQNRDAILGFRGVKDILDPDLLVLRAQYLLPGL